MAPRQRLSTSPPPPEDEHQSPRTSASSPLSNNNNNNSSRQKGASVPNVVAEAMTTTTVSEGRRRRENKSSPQKARDRHDVFNLIALVPLISCLASNWSWAGFAQGQGLQTAWHGDYFLLLWSTSMLYFLVDLVWVACTPSCVKSPGVIVKHHVLVIFYLMAPMIWPEYRWFMGACLTVEVNTWFLIARRWCYKNAVAQWVQTIVSNFFYASWVAIRCGIYPTILVIFLRMVDEAYTETGTLAHWPIVFLPIHFVLCVLNVKWTYDLFSPMFKKMIGGGSTEAPSSGL